MANIAEELLDHRVAWLTPSGVRCLGYCSHGSTAIIELNTAVDGWRLSLHRVNQHLDQ
jgi:hypothetical protein